jgi:predicted AAA+ superfamily ATPase
LSSNFRGRVFQYNVFPLTFKEVLLFNAISIKEKYSSKELGIMDSYLRQIMVYGSYPEIVLANNNIIKENIIKDYIDIMIYKDLMERYHIENEVGLRFFIKRII